MSGIDHLQPFFGATNQPTNPPKEEHIGVDAHITYDGGRGWRTRAIPQKNQLHENSIALWFILATLSHTLTLILTCTLILALTLTRPNDNHNL